jgi:hypothetical protein
MIVGDSRGFTIDNPADVDLVLINLDRTGDTSFSVNIDGRNGANFDTFIRLFDTNGNQLAFNDDGAAPGEAASKFSFLTFTIPANFNSDFIWLGVSSALNRNYDALSGGNDSGGSSTGQYTINIARPAPTGWVGGSVYNDRNRNRKKDSKERGIGGIRLFLDLDNDGKLDAGEPLVVTDKAGQYIFTGLRAGTYTVRVLPSPGWARVSAHHATIANGQHSVTNDFLVHHGSWRHES